MISAWTKHLKDAEEKERFKGAVLGSKIVFKRLSELLNESDTEHLQESNDYDNPNWAYRQADINGYRRALRYIQKLINLDHEEK